MRIYATIALVLIWYNVAVFPAFAGEAPSEEALLELKQKIESDPENFDIYYSYAQMAILLGKEEEAKETYLFMLASYPHLYRIKLDLGMLYLRTGQYEDARHLFEEVLATGPPKKVEKNIHKMLKKAEADRKRGRFGASVSLGINHDSNANSAAGSGAITINGISIPLDNDFQKQKDNQVFGAVSLQHSYRISPNAPKPKIAGYWNSRATYYRADQSKLDEQNVQAFILQMGPSIEIKPLRTTFNLNGGYQYVTLDGRGYLHVKSGELSAVYKHNEKLALISSFSYEDRRFVNSPSVSTYTDRNGEAYQARLGLNYRVSKKDIFAVATTLRREETRQVYYDNDQVNIEGSYTRILPYNMFANVLLNYRISDYDGPDPLVSLVTTRAEYEKRIGMTIGKTFKHNTTYTMGYQYRRIDANLQNYDYTNHRFSAAIGWSY